MGERQFVVGDVVALNAPSSRYMTVVKVSANEVQCAWTTDGGNFYSEEFPNDAVELQTFDEEVAEEETAEEE